MNFEYNKPNNLEELFNIQNSIENSCYLAGGTDLIVKTKNAVIGHKNVIDLQNIKEFKGITEKKHTISIGSLETHSSIETSDLILKYAPVVAKAASEVGSVQIRNMGTIGGNICNASPAADLVPALMALNATITLFSPNHERVVALNDFFNRPSKPNIEPNEVLKSVEIQKCNKNQVAEFIKIGKRKSMAISVINGAVYLEVADGIIKDARVILGSVAAKAIHLTEVEDFLRDNIASKNIFAQAAMIAKKSIIPISDVRSTKEYRTHTSGVIVERALIEAVKTLGGTN